MKTITLLRSIGYPTDREFDPVEITEDPALYDLARQNKIGSLYVETLSEHGELSALTDEYEERRTYHENLEATYGTLSRAMERFDGAVVKSNFPFWADSSDVDVVVFDEAIDDLESIFAELGYEISGVAPTALSVRDPETGQLVDVQSDFGLHNVLYFDKDTLEVERLPMCGHELPVASRPTDLALHVNHSVTELMFTLKEFYTALCFLETFDDGAFYAFLDATYRNASERGCHAFFTVVEELSRLAFGTYPDRIDEIQKRWGRADGEQRKLTASSYATPHKYTFGSFVGYTVAKCRQQTFRRSLARQVPHFANPKTAAYIAWKIYDRVSRQDYVNETVSPDTAD